MMEECHGDVASATNPTQPNPHPAFFFCPPTEKSRSTDRHEHECALARMREGKGRAEARREESLRAWWLGAVAVATFAGRELFHRALL